MNAENAYEEQEPADPACIQSDLEYCLSRCKELKQVLGNMEQQVSYAVSVVCSPKSRAFRLRMPLQC